MLQKGKIKETREGWHLLTVETEANGDSWTTNELCPSLVGSLGLSCRYKRFCHALAGLVGPIQIMFFYLTGLRPFHSERPERVGPC
jgi:hypothetical protein